MDADDDRANGPIRRSPARWFLPPVAAAVLLAALAGTSETYEVDTRGDVPTARAFGRDFAMPACRGVPGFIVSFGPQERFSTTQVLVPRRGLLRDGAAASVAILRGRHGDWTDFPMSRGTLARFRHVNPFRASLRFNPEWGEASPQPGGPYRLEVNVPDRSLEYWYGDEKLETVELPPPRAALVLCPLLASAAAAALLLSLLRLARPREAPVPAAVPSRLRPGAVAALLAAGGTLAGAAVFLGVFRAMPGFGDEMNYLFQARLFASGRTWVPEPALREFFEVDWMDLFGTDGRVWGFHPPGNSVLLAIGWLAGVRWITVPVVFGLNLAVTWLLGLRLLGSRRAALLGVALAATSHYVLSLSSSYMAHGPSYLFLALGWLFVLGFRERPRPGRLALAGAAFGAAFVVRPLSAVLGALVPLALVLARPRKHGVKALAAGASVGVLVSSLAFLYTWSVAGRWDLPYSVKGPEAGQTLAVRLNKGPGFAQTNVYRNLNEFQHRVHSFGILLNTAPFFVPLLPGLRRRASGALLAGVAFAVFAVLHSVLHWYGWKWEPRMLFDVSFLFFLVSGLGLAELAERLRVRRVLARAAFAVAALAAAWLLLVDLPRRARTEYRDYNEPPYAVRDAVRRNAPSNAVVFFEQKNALAAFIPDDAPSFSGPVVYALHRGEEEDYRLLSRFPDRTAWLSRDGRTLERRESFLRSDAARLAGDLSARGLKDAFVVVPWCRVAPSPRLDRIPGRVVEAGDLLADLGRAARDGDAPRDVVLVGSAVALGGLLTRAFGTEDVPLAGYEGRIRGLRVDPRSGVGFGGRIPGLRMTCYEGTRWEGAPIASRFVASFDLAACSGEERSIRWEADLVLEAPRRLELALESDDGCVILVDGRTVLDNGVETTRETTRRTVSIALHAGVHRLEVKYFNGPGEARLFLAASVDGSPQKPLGAASHPGEILLAAEPDGRPGEVAR